MTNGTDEPPTLIVRRTISIARERVFDAWLDPARLALFMRPRGEGHADVTVDPRVGGSFRIVMITRPAREGTVPPHVLAHRPSKTTGLHLAVE